MVFGGREALPDRHQQAGALRLHRPLAALKGCTGCNTQLGLACKLAEGLEAQFHSSAKCRRPCSAGHRPEKKEKEQDTAGMWLGLWKATETKRHD